MKESNYDARFNLDEGRSKLKIVKGYKKDPDKFKVTSVNRENIFVRIPGSELPQLTKDAEANLRREARLGLSLIHI